MEKKHDFTKNELENVDINEVDNKLIRGVNLTVSALENAENIDKDHKDE